MDFKHITEQFSKYGLKPSFYSKEEMDTIISINDAYDAKVSYHTEQLFTVFKPIDSPVNEESHFSYDRYGVRRMNSVEFLVRPNMPNLDSCHSIPSGQHRFGNLNYLGNPMWACFGIYNDNTPRYTLSDFVGRGTDYTENKYHNYLASVNVALGWMNTNNDDDSDRAVPILILSRVYGDTEHFYKALPKVLATVIASTNVVPYGFVFYNGQIPEYLEQSEICNSIITLPVTPLMTPYSDRNSRLDRYCDFTNEREIVIQEGMEDTIINCTNSHKAYCETVKSDVYRFSSVVNPLFNPKHRSSPTTLTLNLHDIRSQWYSYDIDYMTVFGYDEETVVYCTDCGCSMDADDGDYTTVHDEIYCHDCLSNNFTYDDINDEYISNGDAICVLDNISSRGYPSELTTHYDWYDGTSPDDITGDVSAITEVDQVSNDLLTDALYVTDPTPDAPKYKVTKTLSLVHRNRLRPHTQIAFEDGYLFYSVDQLYKIVDLTPEELDAVLEQIASELNEYSIEDTIIFDNTELTNEEISDFFIARAKHFNVYNQTLHDNKKYAELMLFGMC